MVLLQNAIHCRLFGLCTSLSVLCSYHFVPYSLWNASTEGKWHTICCRFASEHFPLTYITGLKKQQHPKENKDSLLLCLILIWKGSMATNNLRITVPSTPGSLWNKVICYFLYHGTFHFNVNRNLPKVLVVPCKIPALLLYYQQAWKQTKVVSFKFPPVGPLP